MEALAAELRTFPAMRASRPAAGTPLALGEVRAAPVDPLAPGGQFFRGLDPADPLIPRQWSDIVPGCERFRVQGQGLFQVGRKLVDYATGDESVVSHPAFSQRTHSPAMGFEGGLPLDFAWAQRVS